MKKRILCLLLTLCLTTTLTAFSAFADGEIVIQGDDIVCPMKDYEFSFILPDGYTGPESGYEFEKVGSSIDNIVEKDGVCTATVEKDWYDTNDSSFDVIVSAYDPSGELVFSRKTVKLASDHIGEYAWNVTPNRHQQIWSCCGTVISPSENHTFKNGVCTVCGTPNINESSQFSDVKAGTFCYDAVQWAAENGVTKGFTESEFVPNGTCTRAQVVTFLWRVAGQPTVDTEVYFADVKENTFYYKAVQWAVENKITMGFNETTFDPNGICTRAQVVTFLWRAAGQPTVSGDNVFVDVPANAYYAKAVQWAVENDITKGTDGKHFAPNNTCTRAQTVTFLYRAQAAK